MNTSIQAAGTPPSKMMEIVIKFQWRPVALTISLLTLPLANFESLLHKKQASQT